MGDILDAAEVELGAVVWLVEDTEDGPRRTALCERLEVDGYACFGGFDLGDDRRRCIIPDVSGGRRIEWFRRDPGFRSAPESWLYGRWLVVDTETTGLEDAAIVELGAVVMQEGRVIEHRSGLFNPGKPIDPGAAAVHGITDEVVCSRPRIDQANPKTGMTPAMAIDRMAAKWRCSAIVGYNLVSFDLPLLRRELGTRWCELEAAIGVVVDPLVIVRLDQVGRFWKGTGRHKLTAVAERFHLCGPEHGIFMQAHRASWDCVLAGRILWHLREHLPVDAAEAHRLCGAKGEEQRRDLDAYWAARTAGAKG